MGLRVLLGAAIVGLIVGQSQDAIACGEFVPMMAIGPRFERSTGAHLVGGVGIELNHGYGWFCDFRLLAYTTPGVDAVFDVGHYWASGFANVNLGFGYGGAQGFRSGPVLSLEGGILGRGFSLAALYRPDTSRDRSVTVLFDLVHLFSWVSECVIQGGSGMGPSHNCDGESGGDAR